MIRITTLFCAFLLLIGCSSQPSVPKGILPLTKMQPLVWDMIRADEWVNIRSVTDTGVLAKKQLSRTDIYQQIFRSHQVTREEFKKSMAYYQSHPNLMKIVLDSLYNRATAPPPPPPASKLSPKK